MERHPVAAALSSRAREARTRICAEIIRVCRGRWDSGIRALVLTGSLARNEATFVEDNGQCLLFGDTDCFWVFHDTASLPSPESAAAAMREIEKALLESGFVVQIGASCVIPSYFQQLRRHISAYEIRETGEVIWGDRQVLALIPAFGAEQISREDAWRLLANRVVEQIEVLAVSNESERPAAGALRYRTIKLCLDIATSFLVFAGRYRPSYQERQLALDDLAVNPSAASPLPIGAFADLIRDCTHAKLTGAPLRVSDEQILEDSARYAKLLWEWELLQLGGAIEHPFGKDPLAHWMRQQPLRGKLRGWASVLRRTGWVRQWREWPRWARLARCASPRYWIYGAAAELFFAYADAACDNRDWSDVMLRLPVPVESRVVPEEVVWQFAAQRVARNYRVFLETTAA